MESFEDKKIFEIARLLAKRFHPEEFQLHNCSWMYFVNPAQVNHDWVCLICMKHFLDDKNYSLNKQMKDHVLSHIKEYGLLLFL